MSVSRTPPKGTKASADDVLHIPRDSDTASDRILSDSDSASNFITSRKLKRKQGDLHLVELRELFDEFSKIQSSKFDALTAAMTQLKEETADMKKSVTFMSQKYDEVLESLVKIQKENSFYKVQVGLLEQRIDFLERKAKSTTFELRNVPQSSTETKENITQVITKVCEVIKQPIQRSDIRDIYRLKTKPNVKNISPIIVELTSTNLKENVIQKAKLFNKSNKENKLNSSHLMIDGPPKPIYISESLTPFAKKLYYLARQHAKKHSFSGCWHSYGKIYLKKRDDLPAIRIDNEEDIIKLSQA
ncbi:hypothetical protein PYW08_010207 [Mythimna loreyi]|uniref:Uncharacterized protein n=1 Tax=Mythimna loreyi TaxID=667449 RepID=A0ACC2Q5X9_9NEOP|nr:hypothetical protein PYW08_010207 [Mythimna loreyi]